MVWASNLTSKIFTKLEWKSVHIYTEPHHTTHHVGALYEDKLGLYIIKIDCMQFTWTSLHIDRNGHCAQTITSIFRFYYGDYCLENFHTWCSDYICRFLQAWPLLTLCTEILSLKINILVSLMYVYVCVSVFVRVWRIKYVAVLKLRLNLVLFLFWGWTEHGHSWDKSFSYHVEGKFEIE